jgi:hypothetical protein
MADFCGGARHGRMEIMRHSGGDDDLGALQTVSQAIVLNYVK